MQKLMRGLYVLALIMPIVADPYSVEATEELSVNFESIEDGALYIEIQWPVTFTKPLEIYSTTNLIQHAWQFAHTNINTSLSNSFSWVNSNTNASSTFYAACNADLDEDGDALASAREKYIYKTDPLNPDSDGDGLDDGWELLHGFNPLSLPGAGDAEDDADSDGVSNIGEYVAGSDPRTGGENAQLSVFSITFYQPDNL
jgi:hypothetical protein